MCILMLGIELKKLMGQKMPLSKSLSLGKHTVISQSKHMI